MLMIRWVYPPLSTRQKIKNMVCIRKMGGPKRTLGAYKKNRAWMGSGVIQMGSYFGKMTPRGSGSFSNGIFDLPRPKNIFKSPEVRLNSPRVRENRCCSLCDLFWGWHAWQREISPSNVISHLGEGFENIVRLSWTSGEKLETNDSSKGPQTEKYGKIR